MERRGGEAFRLAVSAAAGFFIGLGLVFVTPSSDPRAAACPVFMAIGALLWRLGGMAFSRREADRG
jgi:hypothetical protein